MKHSPHRRSSCKQRGVGLIEVLIAVLIMGIGLLGVAAMQATALRNTQGSMGRSQAVVQTYAIIDAMRANRDIAITSGYNMAMTCAAGGGTDLAANDRNRWVTDLQRTVAQGACGQINCVATNCTITVQWDESHSSDATAAGTSAGLANYSIATQVLL